MRIFLKKCLIEDVPVWLLLPRSRETSPPSLPLQREVHLICEFQGAEHSRILFHTPRAQVIAQSISSFSGKGANFERDFSSKDRTHQPMFFGLSERARINFKSFPIKV